MAEQKERKPWQDMTFRELDNKALIEYALSLGKKKGAEALTVIQAQCKDLLLNCQEERRLVVLILAAFFNQSMFITYWYGHSVIGLSKKALLRASSLLSNKSQNPKVKSVVLWLSASSFGIAV